MVSSDIQEIPIDSPKYPEMLRHIPDPPPQLYVRGNVETLSSTHMLAVVGSRKASAYGKQAIDILLPRPISAGVVVVSGLAYGIDSLAHKATVAAHKPTVAVLAGGIDDASIYPRVHKALAHEILAEGGTLVSEHPAGTAALPAYFLQRNRIIAGLCQATLVVQAATKSGSLVTARLALDYNRDVLAVPGQIVDPLSQGTNALLHDGALVTLSPQTILDIFDIEASVESAATTNPLNDSQYQILQLLTPTPTHINDITGIVQLPAEQVASTLLELELLDQVMHVGGMKYIRK